MARDRGAYVSSPHAKPPKSLRFERDSATDGLVPEWFVYAVWDGTLVGEVRWQGPAREYWFKPATLQLLTPKDLKELHEFLGNESTVKRIMERGARR